MPKVIIIGAGISGLTAGWYLKKSGYDVQILEKNATVGGPMQAFQKDGWLAEEGPGSLLMTSEHISDLITELELSDEVITARPEAKKRYIVKDGKPVAVPSSLSGFFKTKLLRTRSKMKVLREPFVKKALQDESLADFVRRRLGSEVLERFINPFVGGIYAGNPEKLSTKYAFPRLFNLEQEHGSLIKGTFKGGPTKDPDRREIPKNKAGMISFKNGLQTLPQTIAEKGAFVNTNVTVQKITKHENHYSVQTNAGEFTSEILIYAGSAHGCSHIDWPKEIDGLKELSKITYPPVTVVSLGFRKDQIEHPLDGFGMLIPEVENFNILGVQFNSSFFEYRTPDEDHVLLTCFVGGMRQPEIALSTDVTQIALQDLRKLIGISGEPIFSHHRVWEKAIPQYEMGYQKYHNIMDQTEQNLTGFYLSGNFRNGISLGDSITGSIMLAKRISREKPVTS